MKIGIALYNIELHGCLNGVFTNDGGYGEISNEVAKLKQGTEAGEDKISGEYDCFYFDEKNTPEYGTLTIVANNKHKIKTDIYEFDFTWKDTKGNIDFKGIGYKMNEKQIAVHYTHVSQDNLVPKQ
jgi:hypothetical protein